MGSPDVQQGCSRGGGMEGSSLLPPTAVICIKAFHIVAGVIIPGTVTVKLRLNNHPQHAEIGLSAHKGERLHKNCSRISGLFWRKEYVCIYPPTTTGFLLSDKCNRGVFILSVLSGIQKTLTDIRSCCLYISSQS